MFFSIKSFSWHKLMNIICRIIKYEISAYKINKYPTFKFWRKTVAIITNSSKGVFDIPY